jgi:hypothetical protein
MKKRTFDLDGAFSDVLAYIEANPSLSTLERHAQEGIAYEYYVALDETIDRSQTERLCKLLAERVPVPIFFLPVISYLMSQHVGKRLKTSRPSTYTRGERLSIYMKMCEEVHVNKKAKSKVFDEFSLSTLDNGDVSEKTFSRIWDELSKDESIPKFYQNLDITIPE